MCCGGKRLKCRSNLWQCCFVFSFSPFLMTKKYETKDWNSNSMTLCTDLFKISNHIFSSQSFSIQRWMVQMRIYNWSISECFLFGIEPSIIALHNISMIYIYYPQRLELNQHWIHRFDSISAVAKVLSEHFILNLSSLWKFYERSFLESSDIDVEARNDNRNRSCSMQKMRSPFNIQMLDGFRWNRNVHCYDSLCKVPHLLPFTIRRLISGTLFGTSSSPWKNEIRATNMSYDNSKVIFSEEEIKAFCSRTLPPLFYREVMAVCAQTHCPLEKIPKAIRGLWMR